jgi:vacuolar-type H+-ATPase subunit I/STV1
MVSVILVILAILASLGLLAWLIVRAIKQRSFSAHTVSYALAILAGVLTYAYFLSMELPQLVKILISILLGAALIIMAAWLQLRRRARKS